MHTTQDVVHSRTGAHLIHIEREVLQRKRCVCAVHFGRILSNELVNKLRQREGVLERSISTSRCGGFRHWRTQRPRAGRRSARRVWRARAGGHTALGRGPRTPHSLLRLKRRHCPSHWRCCRFCTSHYSAPAAAMPAARHRHRPDAAFYTP